MKRSAAAFFIALAALAAGAGSVSRAEPVPEGVSPAPSVSAPAPSVSAPAPLPSAGASPASSASGGSSTPGTPALTLADVLGRYADAIGGRARLAKIHSTVSVSTSMLLGQTVVTTTTVKAPSSFLQVMQIEGTPLRSRVGFDGKTAWLQSPTGGVRILAGTERAEMISQAAGANNSELFPDRWPTTVTLAPTETIDGHPYLALSIKPKGGIATLLLLDTQTYRPEMERLLSPKGNSVSVVQTFGTGPLGELQATVVTTDQSNGLPALTSVLRSVKDNVTVNDAIFAPPLGKGGETV